MFERLDWEVNFPTFHYQYHEWIQMIDCHTVLVLAIFPSPMISTNSQSTCWVEPISNPTDLRRQSFDLNFELFKQCQHFNYNFTITNCLFALSRFWLPTACLDVLGGSSLATAAKSQGTPGQRSRKSMRRETSKSRRGRNSWCGHDRAIGGESPWALCVATLREPSWPRLPPWNHNLLPRFTSLTGPTEQHNLILLIVATQSPKLLAVCGSGIRHKPMF